MKTYIIKFRHRAKECVMYYDLYAESAQDAVNICRHDFNDIDIDILECFEKTKDWK